MSQRLTLIQQREFEKAYEQCMEVIIKDMLAYKKEIIHAMNEHKFQCELNFLAFAREAFLNNIQKFHDHYYSLEAATQSFKEIINKRP
jgi:hypothetical protein